MKIATFNVNNIRRRLPNLLAWLREAKPDVVCLQELKTADAEFPAAALRKVAYQAVWKGQKTWNGVAILARGIAESGEWAERNRGEHATPGWSA
jgi:exodeoxyribonuclease-3